MPIELTLHYDGRFQDEAPVLPVNTDNPGYGLIYDHIDNTN